MFHLKKGLFFDRQKGGGVVIYKTYDGREVRPDNVVMEIRCDVDGLCSIMASLSERGESGKTFREAKKFLTVTEAQARKNAPHIF